MEDAINNFLHSQSDTRWTSKLQVVKPIFMKFEDLTRILQNMSENYDINNDTRADTHFIFLEIN